VPAEVEVKQFILDLLDSLGRESALYHRKYGTSNNIVQITRAITFFTHILLFLAVQVQTQLSQTVIPFCLILLLGMRTMI